MAIYFGGCSGSAFAKFVGSAAQLCSACTPTLRLLLFKTCHGVVCPAQVTKKQNTVEAGYGPNVSVNLKCTVADE